MALGHDPLSSALANLDVRCTLEGPARLRAPWSISSNGKRCARFYVLLSGRCWLYAPELRAPVRLAQGDLAFATADSEHRLCDRLMTPARNAPKTGSPGSGPATLLLRGEMHLPQERIGPLLSPLPRVVHLPGGGPSSSWLASAFGAVAAASLRGERAGMKEIARRAGYASEAAFSSAFKKWSGRPPSAFRGEA
jgi:AraC-like DNA-binding protein